MLEIKEEKLEEIIAELRALTDVDFSRKFIMRKLKEIADDLDKLLKEDD